MHLFNAVLLYIKVALLHNFSSLCLDMQQQNPISK